MNKIWIFGLNESDRLGRNKLLSSADYEEGKDGVLEINAWDEGNLLEVWIRFENGGTIRILGLPFIILKTKDNAHY